MEESIVSPRGHTSGEANTQEAQAPVSLTASHRSSSQQPNEKLLSYVRDFSLANRFLNVRIYQVFHTSASAASVSDCVGYRVAATDEGENDYALFISRIKGEQLYKTVFPGRTDPMTAEAVASSVLNHLDIVGNRHREVGRMICREPQATPSKKERVAPPPKTPSKQRNAHLPSKEQDKRTSRNKQTQQRTHEAIAASHEQPTHVTEDQVDASVRADPSLHNAAAQGTHSHFTAHGEVAAEMPKGRKTSELSLLHRIANADATTMWRSDLGAIGDEADEAEDGVEEEEEEEAAVKASNREKSAPAQYKRMVPERKTKHKELQQRRNNERNQRLHVMKAIPKSPLKDAAATHQGSPPRLATNSPSLTRQRPSLVNPPVTSQVAASAVIGNAHALKAFVGSPQLEQEQFLRRKTTLVNERRVFKTEGVFDETLGVEITNERPDNRSMEYAPGSPVASPQRRTSTKKRRSKAQPQPDDQDHTATASEQATSPEPSLDPTKASPRPEQGASRDDFDEVLHADRRHSQGEEAELVARDAENQLLENADRRTPRSESATSDGGSEANGDSSFDEGVADERRDDESVFAPEEELSAGEGVADHDIPTEQLLPMLHFDEHQEDQFTNDSPPRSARLPTARTIHIVEEDEVEEAQSDAQSQRQEEEQTNASPRPEVESQSHEQQLPSMASPRVECWEEELPQHEPKSDTEEAFPRLDGAKRDDLTIDESQTVETPWVSAPDSDPIVHGAENAEPAEVEGNDGVSAEVMHHDDEGAAERDDPIVEVEPLKPAPIHVDDAIIEMEPLKQSPTAEPSNGHPVDHPVGAASESPHDPSPSPSTSLKRSVEPHAARRTSIVDAQASAIAAAAAAAAATATTAPPTEEDQPKRSPKSAAKRTKRRSHDGIPSLSTPIGANHAPESRREKIRRSTLHGLPSVLPIKASKKQLTDAEGGEAASDDKINMALDTIEGTPPSTAAEIEAHDHHHHSLPHYDSNTHHSPSPNHDAHSHRHQQQQHHKRTQEETEALQRSPGYHTKWEKWKNGKQLIEKVSCLQLEEKLMEDPYDETTLVKLGMRYARWPATSLAAALLLENASGPQQDGSHNHEYWNSLGSAHFDVFLRNRKFLPLASFHLGKCMQAFTRAFTYIESLADPLLLLRYAICLFWEKSDNNANLERADDILREMFARFAKFGDHDRGNLLFLHFQILCRLKMFGEAMECLAKIMALHNTSLEATTSESRTGKDTDSEASTASNKGAPTPYDSNDYLLMLMHCQQARGDFLQSSLTFTQLLKQLHGRGVDASDGIAALEDHDYLHLWGSLADKCFQQEDYALAVDFYGLAATYAKDSRVLARMLYNHALCYQAIGEHLKCNAEFKRAKNLNRHVMPFATLAEIHARYDDTYATLLRTPVDWIIEEVRQTLYDRAVSALQRLFRRKKEARVAADAGKGAHRIQSGGARASIDRRRQSITELLHAGNRSMAEAGSSRSTLEGDDGDSVVVDSHGEFLKRQAVALKKLEKMRSRPVQKSNSFNEPQAKVTSPNASGLLSPWKDRPDLRRQHSMDAFARQFGYVPGGRVRYCEYWKQLVVTALDLYETHKSLDRHIARIRSTLPLVSMAVACCALADALGDVEVALERLHDTTYEHELQLVSGIMDIDKLLHQRFSAPCSETTAPTRFPPIALPVKTPVLPSSPSPQPLPNKHHATLTTGLPPCSPSLKVVRLSSLIDAQFTAAATHNRVAAQEASVLGKQLHGVDRFAVLDEFRQVNTSLLHGWQR